MASHKLTITHADGLPVEVDALRIGMDERYDVLLQADNPGEWFFHCHSLYHMESGMALVITYEI